MTMFLHKTYIINFDQTEDKNATQISREVAEYSGSLREVAEYSGSEFWGSNLNFINKKTT